MTFRCRGVLLDMDGTLVDSTASVEAQWGRWAARHGLRLADVLKISHGVPALQTMRRLAPQAATEEEHERFMREEEEHESESVAVHGAVGFVESLPARRWGVVTSAPRSLALRRMQAAGFPRPPILIAPEDVTRGKPDPLPYLAGAERLGFRPADCFVVEDAPAGIASARAAGMQVVGITTTYGPERLGCDVTIPDFDALRLETEGDGLLIHARLIP